MRRAIQSRVISKCCWMLIIVALFSLPLFAVTEESDNFSLTLTGSKTWTLGYGIGDAEGLALSGVSPYQLTLDQSLAVDIKGEALSVLTINAHFNDKEPASMQTLTINLDTGNLKGVLGDFSLTTKQAFAIYNKKLKGIRLDYSIAGATVTGILSQVEGISESQTFVGSAAHTQVLFTASQPDTPWIPRPYRTNIAGLYAYPLSSPFIKDFSEVNLTFSVTAALRTLLTNYDLGYLFDDISASPVTAITKDNFVVVTDGADTLILKSEPSALLRKLLQDAITTYNDEHDLSDDDSKTYPFATGSDYELEFLSLLTKQVNLKVDDSTYLFSDGVRHRFYTLGRTSIKDGSIAVEISLDGETFLDISDPELSGYEVTTYESEGIVKFDFPSQFFGNEKSAVRISFDYSISGGMFSLGLSIVPGSDRVYLNGKLLVRDTDYSIDYDLGILMLLTKVGDEDTVRIDYERSRGGLGSSAEYARNFYGAILTLPLSSVCNLEFSLLQASDSKSSAADQDRAHTMPNTHTITGVVGSIDLEGFDAQFTLGYNNDVFPLDDNERINLPNQITSILVVGDYTLIASLNGLSVLYDGGWTAYTAASGLSSNRIYAMTSDGEKIYFATSSGLTVLSLTGTAPFDQVENWSRYYIEDGLPNAAVHSILLKEDTLYLGTEDGLAVVPVASLDDPESWNSYQTDSFGVIYALARDNAATYVGTDQGLFTFSAAQGFSPVPDTQGQQINALLFDAGTLYIASGLGLHTVQNGNGTGWLHYGEPVYSVAIRDGSVYYGTDRGLYAGAGELPMFSDRRITSLATDGNGVLWAGSRADAEYLMFLWRIDDTTDSFANSTILLDGRDAGRFSDIPAAGHTKQGIIARASFQQTADNYSLSGSFESVPPTFTTIGQLGRRDSTGWQLDASAHIADGVDITASHSYYEADHSTDQPRDTMQNKIGLALDIGPRISLSLNQELVNEDFMHRGFEDATLSYAITVSDRLFSDAIAVSIGWTDNFSSGINSSVSRGNTLSTSGSWKISPDININGSWSRPMTFAVSSTSGSEKWNVNSSFNHSFPGLRSSLTYTISGSKSLSDNAFDIVHTAKLDLRPDAFAIASSQITPRFIFGGEYKGNVGSLNGQLSLRATISDFSAQSTFSRDLSGFASTRLQTTDRLSLNLGYTGIPDLKPTVSFSQNASTVTYRGESRGSSNRTLTGSLSWTPTDGRRDTLRVSLRSVSQSQQADTLSLTLNNTYTFSYDPFSEGLLYQPLAIRIYVDGRYADRTGTPDIGVTIKGTADVTLSQTWQTSLSASYLTGTKSDGDFYNSILFELFVGATF